MNAIEVSALSRSFGEFVAVQPVSFDVYKGEIFGWLGANGAGKSTTIRMLIGLLQPTSGDALVAGRRVSNDPEGIKARIGYMSQRFSLYPELRVEHNLDFFGGAYGLSGRHLKTRKAAVAEQTGITPLLQQVTRDLPGGQRQAVALAASLLHEPAIVFLDEPTAGVDPTSRRLFWKLIRDLAAGGTTVFVTTHYMDEAENCARIGLMVDGRLAALDTPEALVRTFVPGRVLAVSGRGAPAAAQALQGRAGVLAIDRFGAGLHVRTEPDLPVETLSGWLSHLTDVRLDPSRANLEDVFLAVVGRKVAAHA